MYWKFAHPQAIWDVDKFACSSEQIWRNLAHRLPAGWPASGSSAVNGCRQNECPNNVLLRAKIESYNTVFSSEKVCVDQALFTSKNSPKQFWWILMWEDNSGWTFFTGGNSIIDEVLKLKHLFYRFVSFKFLSVFHFTRHYLIVWSHVDYLWIIIHLHLQWLEGE